MRILLADDEWEITRALKIMLERSQYTVDVAEDGAQALDYLENGSYDAVVLDVMMPQVDGLTVLRRMRAGSWSRGRTWLRRTRWHCAAASATPSRAWACSPT